jgi:histidinol-phosphate/aromatic aminotransferase/cobyric acid decarboxylase-like protein
MAAVDGMAVGDLLEAGETAADLASLWCAGFGWQPSARATAATQALTPLFGGRSLRELLGRAANKADMYNQYSIPFGTAELRAAISAYNKRYYGFAPDVDNGITVCLGATEGFATTLRALCSPGDRVAFFQPFHELYTAQVGVFLLEPAFLTLSEDVAKQEWTFDRSARRPSAPSFAPRAAAALD